jgi:hypothetical protein
MKVHSHKGSIGTAELIVFSMIVIIAVITIPPLLDARRYFNQQTTQDRLHTVATLCSVNAHCTLPDAEYSGYAYTLERKAGTWRVKAVPLTSEGIFATGNDSYMIDNTIWNGMPRVAVLKGGRAPDNANEVGVEIRQVKDP